MSIRVDRVDDPQEAATLLARLPVDPLLDTVALTVLDRILARPGTFPEARWWIASEGDEVRGVAYRTPPFPLGLVLPPGPWLDVVAAVVSEDDPQADLVSSERSRAEAFVAAWDGALGGESMLGLSLLLYRCEGLLEPTGITGTASVTTEADVDLLEQWYEAFVTELSLVSSDPREAAEGLVGAAWLWRTPDGEPVSLASARPPARGVSRVGPVYTPPEHRGQGYAAAVTARVTRESYASGAEQVVLYADAAATGPNRLYPALGYRVVAEAREYALDRPPIAQAQRL